MTTVSLFHTTEERDGMFNSGMEGGASETYERLEELLAGRPAGTCSDGAKRRRSPALAGAARPVLGWLDRVGPAEALGLRRASGPPGPGCRRRRRWPGCRG